MFKTTLLRLLRPGLCIVAAGLVLSSVPACTVAAELVYEPVDGDVSYSAVESLRFREPDERIAYGDDALQFGLLWLPPASSGASPVAAPPPVVVFIHGGCWLNAYNIEHSYALGTALADAGYAVWSLEYRRTGDAGGGWPGTFNDVKSGIAHMGMLDRFAIDTDRFVIAGHSAGGHLALLAGRDTPAATAVLGLAAITDIKATRPATTAASAQRPGLWEACRRSYRRHIWQPIPASIRHTGRRCCCTAGPILWCR